MEVHVGHVTAPERTDLDSDQTLVLCFGAPAWLDDTKEIDAVRRAYPRAQLLGCSTAGEICGPKIHDDGLTVAVARFDRTTLRHAAAPVAHTDQSFDAGRSIAQQLADPTLRSVLILCDGLSVNGSALAAGMSSLLPPSVTVSGGLAGDGNRFARTWVIDEDRAKIGYAAAVGFYGDHVRVGTGTMGGWDLFGPERIVTRAEGNVLFELDGQPALRLYKEYLGDRVSGLPATAMLFPLSISEANGSRERVRTILGIDEARQAMVFAGDIPQGATAQLMRTNFDRLIQGASDAAVLTGLHSGPVLSIAISCVGRRLVLRQRCEEELESTLDVLPSGTQQVGFYSYGEISPLSDGRCELHNQTMTLTTIRED